MSSDNVSCGSRSSSGHSSGDTEGPEEGLNDSDVSSINITFLKMSVEGNYRNFIHKVEEPCSETERKKQEKETERLNKVRRASITESMVLTDNVS